MNTDKLARIYLDNQPIDLVEATPRVAAILFASGKPKGTTVQWLQSRSDPKGKPMLPEEIVDRTAEPTTPIYLTSVDAAFGRSAHPRDIAEGEVAPVPRRESGLDREIPTGKPGAKPGRAGQKDVAGKEDAGQKTVEKKTAGKKSAEKKGAGKKSAGKHAAGQKPPRKQQPWADEPGGEVDAVPAQND